MPEEEKEEEGVGSALSGTNRLADARSSSEKYLLSAMPALPPEPGTENLSLPIHHPKLRPT